MITGTVNVGKIFAEGEAWSAAKFNQFNNFTITFSGSFGTSEVQNGAITGQKSVAGNHFYAQGGATAAASVLGAGADTTRKYTLAWGTNTAPGAAADGMIISFKMPEDHPGPLGITLDIGDGVEKRARKNKSEIILHGDLVLNQIAEFRYDSAGGAWQLLSALGQKDTYYFAGSGPGNTYTLTLTPPGALTTSTLADLTGKRIAFTVPITNTGPSTLGVLVGATVLTAPIRKNGSQALVAGDLVAGQVVEVILDGTNFQMTSHLGNAPFAPVEIASHAKELFITNGGSATQITIGTSGITGSIPTFDIALKNVSAVGAPYIAVNSAGFTINTAVAAGVGVLNTMDVGTLGSGWYYVWIASNGTTTGACLSQSNTAPNAANITSTYPYVALVGAVYANAGVLANFTQIGRKLFLRPTKAHNAATLAAQASYTAISGADLTTFQTIVPPIAKYWWGEFGTPAGGAAGAAVGLAADANGLGEQPNVPGAGGAGSAFGFNDGHNFLLPLATYNYFTKNASPALINATGFEI